jgi:hypothetical protein
MGRNDSRPVKDRWQEKGNGYLGYRERKKWVRSYCWLANLD